ncbi:MAG: DUF2235 domain-containing protein [Reyranellaceae bacterium]
MPKNLVVCCDGTNNEFEENRTNVVKLCFAMVRDPARQLVYYHPGLGTMAAPGFASKLAAWFARTMGSAFGYGVKDDIRDIYDFIMNHYEPGDRLFLFGFSRGAYTVRAVTSLLHLYGLTMRGNESLTRYLVRMLWAIRDLSDARKPKYFQLAADFKEALADSTCKPHFLGVYDTVSSVGWFTSPVALPYTAGIPDVAIARHAVALDERRAFFRTNLIRSEKGRDVLEVWFPGVHSDVGGGYPEAQSGLAKIALEWMAGEARKAGLLLDEPKLATMLGRDGGGYVPPNPGADRHESLTWKWWWAEYVPKRRWNGKRWTWHIYNFSRRSYPATTVVHDAAWQRGEVYAATLPKGAVKLSDFQRSPPAPPPTP